MPSKISLLTYLTILLVCINKSAGTSLESDFIRQFTENHLTNINAENSTKCSNAFNSHFLQFLDANNYKIPTGLLNGNLYDMGHFDECYDIHETLDEEEFYGKYCWGTLPLVDLQKMQADTLSEKYKEIIQNSEMLKLNIIEGRSMNIDGNTAIGLNFGKCLPSFCSIEDFKKQYPLLQFSENNCYSKAKKPELSTGSIVTIAILSFFGGVVVISTIYETLLIYLNKESQNPMLIAFSAIDNGRKILISKSNQLLCLNGLKAISMVWILLFHEYQNNIIGAVHNYKGLITLSQDKANMFYMQGTVAVDTFFTVGGILTVYTFLRAADKGAKFNIPMAYFHRYFRLTPVMGIMILMHAYLLIHMGNGPFWYNVDRLVVKDCQEYWWTALLYIQNIVNPTDSCVPQTWYLSADMQLFVLSPLLLIPLRKWPKYTVSVMGLLILVGMIVPFTITYVQKLPASGFVLNAKGDQFQKNIYFRTWTRFGTYVIGMVTGYYIYEIQKLKTTKSDEKLHTKSNKLSAVLNFVSKSFLVKASIMLVSVIVLVTVVYLSADESIKNKDHILAHAFFNGIFRTAWSIAVSVIVLLCISGNAGPINTFLSLPVFQIINKLSFCMYMVHYAVIVLRVSSLRTEIHYSNFQIMFSFWGDFMITMMISFIYSITFEIPFITVEKYFIILMKKCFSFCKKLIR